eukprot:CAMPEP_0170560274 /NCGR_PEP_ID=MMETSP0211-20121228/47880_1 /TAXON_ID=311385 /ORGANISM="Pseudokeronopsis sp., Strain OXSARD2" /LENGTH=96 /DNA_ID=CAMNT_0010874259 /DNA_START=482 /DNA_END=772 /DNA_ORIENTATION=-
MKLQGIEMSDQNLSISSTHVLFDITKEYFTVDRITYSAIYNSFQEYSSCADEGLDYYASSQELSCTCTSTNDSSLPKFTFYAGNLKFVFEPYEYMK